MKEVISYGYKIFEFIDEVRTLPVTWWVAGLTLWSLSFGLCYAFVPEVFGFGTALLLSVVLPVLFIVVIALIMMSIVSVFTAGNPHP